jgi:hypothetical protein
MVSADGCCFQQHPVTDFHDLPTRPPAFFLRCDIRLEDKEWSGPEPVPALGASFRASAPDAIRSPTGAMRGGQRFWKADAALRCCAGGFTREADSPASFLISWPRHLAVALSAPNSDRSWAQRRRAPRRYQCLSRQTTPQLSV